MSEDMVEDIDASYPDLGSVSDSKEGSLDELEEVEDRVGEGGWEFAMQWGIPPQIFWPGIWQLLRDCI